MPTTRIKWPAIPSSVEGAAGPIRVRRVKRPCSDEGLACWGTWEKAKREIQLDRSAPREHQWRVLFHEMMHATMDDAGLNYLLTPDAEETLCEAVATGRMRELRGMLGR